MTSTDASNLTRRGHEDRYQPAMDGDPSDWGSQELMSATNKMHLELMSYEVRSNVHTGSGSVDIHEHWESTFITEARRI